MEESANALATLGDRLRESRLKIGMTQAQAARKIGISQPSLSALESGQSKSTYHIAKFARLYRVNSKWLETGQGPRNIDINVVPAEMGTRQVPLLNYVQAGVFTDSGYDLDTTSVSYIQTDLDLSEYAFALQIRGDSMAPTFMEGDRVIIDCGIAPIPGDFVVAKNDAEEATFKKFRLLSTHPKIYELLALNPDYPSIRSDQTNLRIIGVMVEHRKYRRK